MGNHYYLVPLVLMFVCGGFIIYDKVQEQQEFTPMQEWHLECTYGLLYDVKTVGEHVEVFRRENTDGIQHDC